MIRFRVIEGPNARDQIAYYAFHTFLVEAQMHAILVPRARSFLVTGSLQIKPSGSVDENEQMLGTYMRRMRNNNLEITIAGSS